MSCEQDADSVGEQAIKDIPPVPIKTYEWEEVRRSKIKGEYPWTYLVKEPFNPNIMETETTEVGLKNGEAKKDVQMQMDKPEGEVKETNLYSEEIKVIEDDSKTTNGVKEVVEDPKPELKSALRSSFRETEVALKNDSEAGPSNDRSKRAKSEEAGKRKRKLSIDSSYSRVSKYSLSKLGAVKKKVKEAAELTKKMVKLPRNPFTKSQSKLNKAAKAQDKNKKESSETPKVSIEKSTEKKPESVLKKPSTPGQPLYIHIPLKPPPGETDEFSHMEFEQKEEQCKKEPSPIKEEELESPVDAPKSVQLIILTAPSDDEILDDVAIPETPSEGDKFFDNTKLDELKTFAKTVADKISPETKRKNISITEVEESKEEAVVEVAKVNAKIAEVPKETKEFESVVNVEEVVKVDDVGKNAETETAKPKKVKKGTKTKKERKTAKVDPKIEDEEDGLKTSEAIVKEIIEAEIKTEVDQTEETPICRLKKNVSFKGRSVEKEHDYEDIASPDDANKIVTADVEPIKEDVVLDLRERGKLEAAQSQSMTVEEEKTYLDAKIMKDTSLDEDCSKWSKSIDHEYEPVNPPPESSTPVNAEPPTKTPQTTPLTPTTPTSSSYDFNTSAPEINLSKTPVHISTSSLERLASKLAEMDLERTGIKSERQSRTSSPNGNEKIESHATKLQEALRKQADNIKNQAEKFKIRVKSIKRPKMPKAPNIKKPKEPSITLPKKPLISLPKRPSLNLPKKPNIHMPKVPTFKISKPNVSMPKMPESIKNINFSSLSLPKRKPGKSSNLSSESTATEPKSKKLFDFSTYPRIFSRKPKHDQDQSLGTTSSDQRTKSDFDSRKTKSDYDSRKSKDSEPSSVRIPLHSADSVEREGYNREDSVERRMHSSHMQYEDDIDIEDAYMRENQKIHTSAEQHSRWTHGSFHQPANEYYNDNNNEETIDNDKTDQDLSVSNGTDNVLPARGVLEEINQDEFFLRQKGISQDNIEVGAYLSSEIREAFKKQPTTVLNQIENEAYFDQNFDRVSNKSLPETPKRKGIKKPSRRKKTPHVSAEAIQASDHNEEFNVDLHQPERPSRKQKLQRQYDSCEMDTDNTDNIDSNILGMEDYKFTDKQFADMYENEIMTGIEQPNITISDAYNKPSTVPRKRKKSQKSQESEQDSTLMIDGIGFGGYESILQRDDISFEKEITTDVAADFNEPPKRPLRTRSRTRSRSRPDEEFVCKSESTASLANSAAERPCVEEPCVKDICDNMGYSVISKHRSRAMDKSNLPPPAPRRKQKKDKFSTVPGKLGKESPSRPRRNYSTLVPNRPPRRNSQPNLTDEEKEVDISQYIEIESEDHNRDLHSGKVIQKMKDRPLPAPPRPPRQTLRKSQTPRSEDDDVLESEVSVQTEPLPDDYIIEDKEYIQDKDDRVGSPVEVDEVIMAKQVKPKYRNDFDHQETITHGTLLVQPFTLEDGTEPQEFFSRSTEKFITVRRDYVDDLDSEIPDEFMHFRSPGEEHIVSIPQVIERIIERPVYIQPDFSSEIELLKAHKLQVRDLDVDNLRVNELQASKITVTEIESSSIQANEINSRGGNLIVGGIELPPSFLQQLLDTIKAAHVRQEQAREEARESTTKVEEEEEADSGQKKTSIEQVTSAIEASGQLPKRPPRHQLEPERGRMSRTTSKETDADTTNVESSNFQQPHVYEDIASLQQIRTRIPSPTPEQVDVVSAPESVVSDRLSPETIKRFRDYSIDEVSPVEDTTTSSRPNNESLDDTPQKIVRKHKQTISPKTIHEETPPPIPPQPNIYSRPPPAFYNLRPMPEFIDEDFPSPPHSPTRRRRPHHHKIVQLPPESSTDDMTPPISRSSRRSRTPEPSIPELTGQLTRACANVVERSIKRILMYFTNSVVGNTDGKQDLHVIVVILLVLLAGLLLLGWGGSHDVHHHHWEYFNPPKDI